MLCFKNSIAQLKAYEKLISVYLLEYMDKVVRQKAVSNTPFEKYKGLVVSMEEAESSFSPAHFSLSEAGKELASNIYDEIVQCSENSAVAGIMLPLDYICKRFNLNMLERFIIAFAALPLINTAYEKTFGYFNDNVRLNNPTLELAISIFAEGDLSVISRLRGTLLKYIFEPVDDENPLKSRLKLRNYFVCLLSSDKFYNGYEYLHLAVLDDVGVICYEEQYAEICKAIDSSRQQIFFIDGHIGSGRKHLLLQCAKNMDNPVLFIDFKRYCEEENRIEADKNIVCELLLRQCYLCIDGVAEIASGGSVDEQKKRIFSKLCNTTSAVTRIIFICTDGFKDIDTDIRICGVKLGELSRSKRYELWQYNGISGDFLHETANKYRFTPKEIARAAAYALEKAALASAKKDEKVLPDEKLIDQCCREQTIDSLSSGSAMGDKAQLIESHFTLDDLILPEEEKQQIREACNHIKFRHIVYDKWNFDSKLSYGKGLVILFAGPPGTGKTMAATIVARELGLAAYRVDISKIMSKYIGETEKSLGEIFDCAERSNSVLFFDETDAIFGKRSEIKDSHDKYANVETSFLLQRLEMFDGVVLMSTNLLQNIDEAFMRRISYIIHFPFPDSEQRLILWKNMFPSEMPLEAEIDFDYLANQFEMSGAAIKNTVMSAAFLAATDDAAINMSHLLRAVKKQLSKQGKIMLKEDFGKYSMFIS